MYQLKKCFQNIFEFLEAKFLFKKKIAFKNE